MPFSKDWTRWSSAQSSREWSLACGAMRLAAWRRVQVILDGYRTRRWKRPSHNSARRRRNGRHGSMGTAAWPTSQGGAREPEATSASMDAAHPIAPRSQPLPVALTAWHPPFSAGHSRLVLHLRRRSLLRSFRSQLRPRGHLPPWQGWSLISLRNIRLLLFRRLLLLLLLLHLQVQRYASPKDSPQPGCHIRGIFIRASIEVAFRHT